MNPKNISKLFAASLSFSGEEKIAGDYSINPESSILSKYAGISIYNPTLDNVESFVIKFLAAEAAPLVKPQQIKVYLTPYKFDIAHQDVLSDASGKAAISVGGGVELEFPFIITDGELMPFDVIQLDHQRVPYSRENLFKVINAIKKKLSEPKGDSVSNFEPYKKVEDPVNPTSSMGFLGDLLRIQEQYSTRGATSSMYVTASQHLGNLIEKTSALESSDAEIMTSLEEISKNAVYSTKVEEFNKYASEVEADKKVNDRRMKKIYRSVKGLQWKDAGSLPHGTLISFPQFDGKEICMASGIVLSEFIPIEGLRNIPKRVVISSDSKVKILGTDDKFLCIENPDAIFKLKSTPLNSIKCGDTIVAFNGDKALPVSRLQRISVRNLSSRWAEQPDYWCDPESDIINGSAGKYRIRKYSLSTIIPDEKFDEKDRWKDVYQDYYLMELDGVKFGKINYREFVHEKAKDFNMSESDVEPFIPRYDTCLKDTMRVFTSDPQTQVVILKDTISNYLRNASDLENMVDSVYTPAYEVPLFKKASEAEYVEIRRHGEPNSDGTKFYDMTLRWVDRNGESFKLVNRNFKNVDEMKMRSILKAIGFSPMRISEATIKTNHENYIKMELPEGATPDNVSEGGYEASVTKTMNRLKDVLFNKGLSTQLVDEAVAHVSHENLIGSPQSNAQKLTTQKAAQSRVLANAFEKLAMDYRLENMRVVAKTMVLANKYFEKTASVMAGNLSASYLRASTDIAAEKHLMEHLATDLTDLGQDQILNHNIVINPNFVRGAISIVDSLYKTASLVRDFCGFEKNAAEYPLDPKEEKFDQILKAFDKIKEVNEKKAAESPEGIEEPEAAPQNSQLISQPTVKLINQVSKQCFQLNRFWDRAVSVLDVDFAMKQASSLLHKDFAHKFPLLADDINEILTKYNINVDYDVTEADDSKYANIQEVFTKGLNEILKLRLLAMAAKESARTSGEGDVEAMIGRFLDKLSAYVAQSLALKDKADQYKDNAAGFDHDISKFFDAEKLASIFDEREPRPQQSMADKDVIPDMEESGEETADMVPAQKQAADDEEKENDSESDDSDADGEEDDAPSQEQVLTDMGTPSSVEQINSTDGKDMTKVKAPQKDYAQRKIAHEQMVSQLRQKLANL